MPVRLRIAWHARRGRGGTEYATEAGMRMYYNGGNAVDAGVATMLAASVSSSFRISASAAKRPS